MKTKFSLLLGTLVWSAALSAQLQFTLGDIPKIYWQPLVLSQSYTTEPTSPRGDLIGASGGIAAYKIPANQEKLHIHIASQVMNNQSVFVPNVLVLDSRFSPIARYNAKQFRFEQERGLQPAQFKTTLALTPHANQDFIYLIVYTTDQDLQGKTTVTHPAKLFAKAKGNQPPAIRDIEIAHSTLGKLTIEAEIGQMGQVIGVSQAPRPSTMPQSPAIPPKAQPVEQSTEAYFNQAVRSALKNNNINQAMNLVNEAEKLGLSRPREIFLKSLSVK